MESITIYYLQGLGVWCRNLQGRYKYAQVGTYKDGIITILESSLKESDVLISMSHSVYLDM